MISLTEKAASEVKKLLADDGGDCLRVAVSGGGCAGFEYLLGLDSEGNSQEDDLLLTSEGVNILIDHYTLALVEGSTIEYSDGLQGKGFTVNNPNVSASCGCGKSFSVDEERPQGCTK